MAGTWLTETKREEGSKVRLRKDNKMFVFERENRREERERGREEAIVDVMIPLGARRAGRSMHSAAGRFTV